MLNALEAGAQMLNNVRWVFSSYRNRRRGVNLIHTGIFYSTAENFSFKVMLSAHVTASG